MRHETSDERHVTAEPVQLGDHDRCLVLARSGEGSGELRAALDGVASFPGLDFFKFGDDGQALGIGEASYGLTLSLKAEAAVALP